MAIYEKPVKLLFKDMVEELGVKKGDVIQREQFFSWFKEKYPKIKEGTISAHLLRLSINAPSRVYYNVHQKGNDDLLFQIDSKRFRLFDPSSDPEPIYKKEPIDPGDTGGNGTPEDPPELSEFAYEKDLQNFLSKNLHQIESGIKLYEEEDITGIEFPAGNRYIDILALDKNNHYVIIELKVSRGYDRVVGQVLRYMAWIKKNHADEGQLVRGVIVARKITEDLLLACSQIPNIELYEYQLSVSLKRINKI
jgi:hypothetical protein